MSDSSNFIATAAAVNASSQASAAASAARAARNAAEESLETRARFVVLPIAKFDNIETGRRFLGLFSITKEKLVGVDRVISIKTTDVANLTTKNDDYGNQFVVVNLEGRSEVEDKDGDHTETLYVPMSLNDVTAILNGQKEYKS